MRVLHVEDNAVKHADIVRQLREMRISDITWKKNLQDGLSAIREDNFDLIITDMSFPLENGGRENEDAGDMLIEIAQREGVTAPIILVTAFRMNKAGIFGTVCYNPDEMWEDDLRRLLKAL